MNNVEFAGVAQWQSRSFPSCPNLAEILGALCKPRMISPQFIQLLSNVVETDSARVRR